MSTLWAETATFRVVALVLTELFVHLKHGCPNRRLARMYVARGHNCKMYVFLKGFTVI
jgi:hypothetical protein